MEASGNGLLAMKNEWEKKKRNDPLFFSGAQNNYFY